MGFKAVKEHYRIAHIVRCHPSGLAIGSGYISDIIVVSPSGKLLERHNRESGDLGRYQREIEQDPAKFADLFASEDVFARSLPVYTYSGGEILEAFCEEFGYPNLTHDGEIMYENRYSNNIPMVVEWAKVNAALGVRNCKRTIRDLEKRLRSERDRLAKEQADLAKLDEDYRDVEIDDEYRQEEDDA
jgi:hypothetical protein